MILVDTAVWIDHLHCTNKELVFLLESGLVGRHPQVVEELALGTIRNRREVLANLERLKKFQELTHTEAMRLIESQKLSGKGLSTVDLHLMGSVLITGNSLLWTRDKRLHQAAKNVNVAYIENSRSY